MVDNSIACRPAYRQPNRVTLRWPARLFCRTFGRHLFAHSLLFLLIVVLAAFAWLLVRQGGLPAIFRYGSLQTRSASPPPAGLL